MRVAAQRDVYLEADKDSAIAMYTRSIAERVASRVRDLGDFARLTPEEARALAAAYDIDCLVSRADLDLPLVYANDRFRVYELGTCAVAQ